MITEDYVSFETAKLLKEKGFDEMCPSCYGPAYLHNGKPIDEDEEFELKCEGKENEIEIEEGGTIYSFWNTNKENGKNVYTRPSLSVVTKWLRITHNIHINIDIHWLHFANQNGWMYIITKILENGTDYVDSKGDENDKHFYSTYEEACENVINYCLTNLI